MGQHFFGSACMITYKDLFVCSLAFSAFPFLVFFVPLGHQLRYVHPSWDIEWDDNGDRIKQIVLHFFTYDDIMLLFSQLTTTCFRIQNTYNMIGCCCCARVVLTSEPMLRTCSRKCFKTFTEVGLNSWKSQFVCFFDTSFSSVGAVNTKVPSATVRAQ